MSAAPSRRLLMLLHGYFPDEVRVAAEVRAAVDAGFAVDVIALRRDGDPPSEWSEGARVYRMPIRHVRGAGLVGMLWEYVGFLAAAAVKASSLERRRRYDLVQVHSPPDFLVLAALGATRRGAPLVLDVHDLSSDMFHMRFAHHPGAGVADRLLRALERFAARRADAVLTVHEPYRRELAARGVAPSTITVIMNALDEGLLPELVQRAETEAFTAVYHGTVTPHYGVHLLVEACALVAEDVPDLRVRIYGEGDAVPDVQARAASLGVADRVWVSPTFLPQRDVLRAVRDASVGVVPNLPTRLNRFALSTKLLEYVALGVPVVCADLPTMREHFDDGEVLFFTAGEADALGAALRKVAADRAAARQRAEAARRRYEDYRWPVNARRYVELLDRLAVRRRAAQDG